MDYCTSCGHEWGAYTGPSKCNQTVEKDKWVDKSYWTYDASDHPNNRTATKYTCNCGKTAGTRYASDGVDYYDCNCGKTAGQRYVNEGLLWKGYQCNCGLLEGVNGNPTNRLEVAYYELNCSQSSNISKWKLACGKTTSTIEKWALGCGQDPNKPIVIGVGNTLNPTMGGTIAQPNYRDTEGSYCIATADWKETVITNYPEPTMAGYKFLGWYDSPNYTIEVKNGVFTHKTSANKITTRTVKPSRDSHGREDLYAHWMPIRAYLNYSYPSGEDGDGQTGNYTAFKNGHVVLDSGNGLSLIHI